MAAARTMLVVDDHPRWRPTMRQRRTGFGVVDTDNAAAAICLALYPHAAWRPALRTQRARDRRRLARRGRVH